jgi:hypothetical protein
MRKFEAVVVEIISLSKSKFL